MNLNLRAVYFCATSGHRWGKGNTIDEAKKNAGIVTAKPNCEFIVWACVFNDPKEHELTNLRNCITANDIDGNPVFYSDDRTQEDTDMINKYLVGWLIIIDARKRK